jgi:hypothetical protein
MRPPRFSIAALLAFIVACGVAFAALRSPSQLWANVVSTAALTSLVIASIDVALARGRWRAFWAGFLIAGGSYFAVYAVPALRESLGPRLATEAALDFLYAAVGPPQPSSGPFTVTFTVTGGPSGASGGYGGMMMGGGVGGGYGPPGSSSPPPSPPVTRWVAWTTPDRTTGVGYQVGSVSLVSPESFRQVGHSLLTLLFAALAGLYARHLYEARDVVSDPARETAP